MTSVGLYGRTRRVFMPWGEQLSDPDELRRCIRDLIALSTLPTLWQKYDLLRIVFLPEGRQGRQRDQVANASPQFIRIRKLLAPWHENPPRPAVKTDACHLSSALRVRNSRSAVRRSPGRRRTRPGSQVQTVTKLKRFDF